MILRNTTKHYSSQNESSDFGFETITKTFDQIKDLLYPEDQIAKPTE